MNILFLALQLPREAQRHIYMHAVHATAQDKLGGEQKS